MKALLLTAAVLLACEGSMFAQNLPPDYHWEVGINGGFSIATRPLGPSNAYQGTSTKVGSDFSVRANYAFNEHWMLGIDIGSRKWASTGTWLENSTFGHVNSPVTVNFLEADHAINESFEFNYMIPFYSRYQNFNKANLYFGVMAGLVTTTNDGSIGYSRYKSGSDSGTAYVSKYDYGMGIGYNIGVQMGYTYYIIPRLGVSVEIAARYADIRTNNVSYGYANSNFYLLYFPETVGVRYRF